MKALSFVLAWFFLGCLPATAQDLDSEIKHLEAFTQALYLIQDQAAYTKGKAELVEAAIEGMARSLDPYSTLLGKREMESLSRHSTGEMLGIGINLEQVEDQFIITYVFPGSPAEEVGVKPGDRLTAINDQPLTDYRDPKLKEVSFGKEGSRLRITLAHEAEPQKRYTIELVRRWFPIQSVTFRHPGPGILLAQVDFFIKGTSKNIQEALEAHQPKVVVLDLRSNPGGLFLAAVETAQLFLDGGKIVELRDKDGRVKETYVSQSRAKGPQPLVIVLINRYSASSAEILAGALKDRKRAILIGENSFGKAVVQSFFELGDDWFLKLTTAKYFTPSGKSFHRVGVQPHIPIPDHTRLHRYGQDDLIYAEALNRAQANLKGP